MSKVFNILRADVEYQDNDKKTVLVSGPPIPEGTYEAEAVGATSDRKAKYTLILKKPSIIDGIKDFVGRIFLGKIKKEEE